MNQPANNHETGIPQPAQPYSEYWNLIIVVPETSASDKTELIDVAVEFELSPPRQFPAGQFKTETRSGHSKPHNPGNPRT